MYAAYVCHNQSVLPHVPETPQHSSTCYLYWCTLVYLHAVRMIVSISFTYNMWIDTVCQYWQQTLLCWWRHLPIKYIYRYMYIYICIRIRVYRLNISISMTIQGTTACTNACSNVYYCIHMRMYINTISFANAKNSSTLGHLQRDKNRKSLDGGCSDWPKNFLSFIALCADNDREMTHACAIYVCYTDTHSVYGCDYTICLYTLRKYVYYVSKWATNLGVCIWMYIHNISAYIHIYTYMHVCIYVHSIQSHHHSSEMSWMYICMDTCIYVYTFITSLINDNVIVFRVLYLLGAEVEIHSLICTHTYVHICICLYIGTPIHMCICIYY